MKRNNLKSSDGKEKREELTSNEKEGRRKEDTNPITTTTSS